MAEGASVRQVWWLVCVELLLLLGCAIVEGFEWGISIGGILFYIGFAGLLICSAVAATWRIRGR